MKKSLLLLVAILVSVVSAAQAVSYPPVSQEPAPVREEDVMKAGDKLLLFHSGTPDVTESIRTGDLLTVFHDNPGDLAAEVTPTGKVKILSTVGDYYFEAEVVEGSVGPGNIAVKGNAGCLVTGRGKRK